MAVASPAAASGQRGQQQGRKHMWDLHNSCGLTSSSTVSYRNIYGGPPPPEKYRRENSGKCSRA